MYCDWGMESTFNLQKYKPGQCYSPEHMEHGNDEITCLRLLGWMVYLNDVNDGGETYWPQQKFKKSARKGDLLIWLLVGHIVIMVLYLIQNTNIFLLDGILFVD